MVFIMVAGKAVGLGRRTLPKKVSALGESISNSEPLITSEWLRTGKDHLVRSSCSGSQSACEVPAAVWPCCTMTESSASLSSNLHG